MVFKQSCYFNNNELQFNQGRKTVIANIGLRSHFKWIILFVPTSGAKVSWQCFILFPTASPDLF